jgi:DNA-3-methyladenine glycosylase
MYMHKLPADFYLQDTVTAAQSLIGCYLARQEKGGHVIGRINETEAYVGPIDKACHAYQYKRTPRTEPLFAAGGIAYVYFIYGKYHCMNVVTEAEGTPCAVLIRGVEIVQGQESAASRRYQQKLDGLSPQQRRNLANGPGKLCLALDITRELNRASLLQDRLCICDAVAGHEKTVKTIQAAPRIGIDYAEEAKDFLWRFYEE